MSLKNHRNPWQSIRRWLPGMVVSAVALWLVLRLVSWQNVVDALSATNPVIMMVAILFWTFGMILRAFGWRTLLQNRVPFKRVLILLFEGYFLNNVFPLRVGEIGRAVLLGRDSRLGFFQVFSTIVVERAYDLAIASALVLSTLPLALKMNWARPLAVAILILVIAGLVSLYLMGRHRERLNIFLQSWGEHWPVLNRWILPKLGELFDGFGVISRPRFFLASFGLILASWTMAIIQDYLLLKNFIPEASWWWVFFVLGVTAIGAGLPSVAASIGVFEAAVVGALSILGVDPGRALAFALVLHVINFILTSIFGAIGLIMEGENLSNLYSDLAARRKTSHE